MLFQIGIDDEITGIGEVATGTAREVQSGVVETSGLPDQIGVKRHALKMNHSLQISR
jgi:hypothetical protein